MATDDGKSCIGLLQSAHKAKHHGVGGGGGGRLCIGLADLVAIDDGKSCMSRTRQGTRVGGEGGGVCVQDWQTW